MSTICNVCGGPLPESGAIMAKPRARGHSMLIAGSYPKAWCSQKCFDAEAKVASLMKIENPKEWYQRSTEIEGDAEIGAGVLPQGAVPCSAWREVSESEFFRVIGPHDVHPSIQPGKYPYTSIWQTPQRSAIGKSVGWMDGGTHKTQWLLPNA